jgi:putative colanic acid biosynthesis acetyltransferase WcaF
MKSVLQVQVGKQECPSPHSFANKLGRVAWALVWLLCFRPSPRLCFGWRRWLLRCFGATVGRNVRISPSVRIWAPWNLTIGDEASIAHHVDCYCVALIKIDDHATVSQYSFLCSASHDISDPNMALTSAPIHIESQAWVCAGAFIGPGLHIRQGAVVGARAVVIKDVNAWTVVAGNPARLVRQRELRISK